ncbi:hypothetical protein MAM1_0356c09989 [Mucor ambiguus]|uniref:F-box domain-containing protein n=1 Tax=Mucor ambiguus TaxID=91626 RepID=A0A0C9N739_9FUNG|nr:hypothetical protein MAM1_0356c09989 [Mucor ambiguus]
MFNDLPQELQSKALSYVRQEGLINIATCRAVCKQWNTLCMQIMRTQGIKVSLKSKRQSKQFLQLLKKHRDFSSIIQQIVVRSKVYFMDFIAILCHCPNLQVLDLGGQSFFYCKLHQLLLQSENTRWARDLPHIEEFKFDDPGEVYSLESMLNSSVICADIGAFRRSIKHLHVVLDFIDAPGFYRSSRMLKDALCDMPNLQKITARYADMFPADIFIEDVLNSKLQRLESVLLAGIGVDLTSKRVYRISPVESLQKLEIYLPCMDVQVLRFIENALPSLKDLCLLSNKNNRFEWMTITGDNPIQTYIIIRKFRDYCDLIPTVLVSFSDEFYSLFAHIHQESFKKIGYIWDVFLQDDDDNYAEDSFDFNNDDSSNPDYDDANDDDGEDEVNNSIGPLGL